MVVEQESAMSFAKAALGVAMYLLPTIIAMGRSHQNKVSIFLLNLILGWTLIGWVVALIWSASAVRASNKENAESVITAPDSSASKYQELARLAELKDKGHLTEEEFKAEKAKILSR